MQLNSHAGITGIQSAAQNLGGFDVFSITQVARAANPSRASALLEELLPAGVAAAELVGEGDPALLYSGERKLLGRVAPKRAREFAGGRLCARRAAAQFGIVDVPIGVRDDRRPLWPRLLTGSITHTDGFSASAVGQRWQFRAIGIDAERIGCVSSDLWSHVFLPAETDWLKSLPVSEQAKAATLMFSAKEAFYKCQYEVTEQWLEFKDVAVDFFNGNLGRGGFTVRPGNSDKLFVGDGGPAIVHFVCINGLVLSAIALTRSGNLSAV